MKLYIFIIMIVASVCSGCKEIYEPTINAEQDVLVVKGLLTDEVKPFTVKLSKAASYNGSSGNSFVSNAKVTVIDDFGNTYSLLETDNGSYTSNPEVFIGQSSRSYHLRIKTDDGNIYESTPQLLSPNDFTDTIYAEYSSQETLVENALGETSKVTVDGIDLLTDIKNNTDSLPRFRYQVNVTTEYEYFIPPHGPAFFCWKTSFPNILANLTDEKYQTSSIDIQKHSLGFIPDYYYITVNRGETEIKAAVVNRIIKIIRYSINNETYQFYKNINLILSAEGKIFDPIAFQLKGNITCKNNPQKLVLGFFEASSVKTRLCAIKPGKKQVITGLTIEPPLTNDFTLNEPPIFWVY